MKRRRRDLEVVTVPVRLAEPFVEDYVESHEVRSLSEAQDLAAVRHSEEWDHWYAAQPVATVEVAVVLDRATLGTSQVDDLVEMTAPQLVGITVAQTRRLLLGEPLPFRDRESFKRGMA